MTEDNLNKFRKILNRFHRKFNDTIHTLANLEKIGIESYFLEEITNLQNNNKILNKVVVPVTPMFNSNWDEFKPSCIFYLVLEKELMLRCLSLDFIA